MERKKKLSWAERLDLRFHIAARNSTIGREFMSGTDTFFCMVYIIAVSAGMYAAAQVDSTLASIAIAAVTCAISVLMGLLANLPIALSTGMGLNAFAVFTICGAMKYPYELVMICTLIEGIIFVILTFTKVRSTLAQALPHNLKMFIGAGIGAFLIYIGAQNSHLIVADGSTLTTLVNFRMDFSTQGICALLAVIGILVIVVLTILDFKAAIIVGIGITWVLGMICQALGVYVPDIEAGYYSLYPSWGFPHVAALGSIFLFSSPVVMQITLKMIIDVIVITLTMLYSDFFDTVGTFMTCVEKIKSQMRDEIAGLRKRINEQKENAAKIKTMEAELEVIGSEKTSMWALFVDAIGTIVGALFKCTTITSFVESGAGIEAGGRTGLSAIVTGGWFFLAIFFASILGAVPGFATGAALIVVGGSMVISAIKEVNWGREYAHEYIPGVLSFIFTALTYNIANGMAVGIIFYVVASLLTGRRKEVHPLFYVLTILLIPKFIFL